MFNPAKKRREYDPLSFDYMMGKDETAPTQPKFDSASDAPPTKGEKALKALGCSCLVILAIFAIGYLALIQILRSHGVPAG